MKDESLGMLAKAKINLMWQFSVWIIKSPSILKEESFLISPKDTFAALIFYRCIVALIFNLSPLLLEIKSEFIASLVAY